MSSKFHKVQSHYSDLDKGIISPQDFKQRLLDMKIRWNPKLDQLLLRVDHSYTALLQGIQHSNKYVRKSEQPVSDLLPVPKKNRREHIGTPNLIC
ncbi:hypothetical protein pb186bvf_016495 [Paramecium bursaria]